jgi:hypothetical protein
MKRAFIIIAILLVLIGIGVIVYLTLGSSSAHLTVGSNAFSDTGSGTANTPAAPSEVTSNTGAGKVVAPNLVEITSAPVSAGVSIVDIAPASTTTALGSSTTNTQGPSDIQVRYIDRESGNIYQYMADARSLTRISDKTLPGVQEASWLPDGSMALVRFLSDTATSETLDTYALPADGSEGYFLAQDLDEAEIIGNNAIFTLAAGTESSIGTIAQLDGTNPTNIFTSPLSSIIVYPAGSSFIAVTKAASEIGGYAFSINPTTGVFTPILGPLDGLTILPSPSGQLVLYSYTASGEYHMGVFSPATGAVVSLPLATFAEKCVWTSDGLALYCGVPTSFTGNLPDDWYQGAVSFTDRIWRIDLTSRLATLVVDPSQTGSTDIDVVNPTLDANNQLLVFRNKKDSSLWAYSL